MDKRTLFFVLAVVIVAIVVLFSKEKKQKQDGYDASDNNTSAGWDALEDKDPIKKPISPLYEPATALSVASKDSDITNAMSVYIRGEWFMWLPSTRNGYWYPTKNPINKITDVNSLYRLGTIEITDGTKYAFSLIDNDWLRVLKGR